MKKNFGFLIAFVVAVILIGTVSTSQAWDRQQQFTFRTPDGGFVQHNDSSRWHLLGNDTWQSTQTHTPASPLKRVEETETISKTWTRTNLDPKCNNEKGQLTDKWREEKKIVRLEDQGTEVVGANSGANPSLLNVTIPAALAGSVGATTQGVFYWQGQKARKAAKIGITQQGAGSGPVSASANTGPIKTSSNAEVNDSGNSKAYGGDAKAYGGDASAYSNSKSYSDADAASKINFGGGGCN